jgi:hypothetical protein
MQKAFAAAAVALALLVLYFVAARSRAARATAKSSEAASDEAPASEELVAVIAAAIAAASGDAIGSFRIAGIAPSADAGQTPCFAGRMGLVRNVGRLGLNTPAWGHVDRFARGESE